MPLTKLTTAIDTEIAALQAEGRLKGKENIITRIIPPSGSKGPRYLLKGKSEQQFIKMNSNSYLGVSLLPELIEKEHEISQQFGVGPGAVRFISGTHQPQRDLEKRLARFHGREDAIIYSSAYSAVLGTISSLLTPETIIISDALNHNCIINAMRLAKPADKKIYAHNNMIELENQIESSIGQAKRLIIVTDGVFSMRGDYAPLDKIRALTDQFDAKFDEGIILIVDDSHGVGAYGATGRGTEEIKQTQADILIGTLGKAFGVNGGYAVSSEKVVNYLREKAITYIYSNPITAGEAATAQTVIDLLNSPWGVARLQHLSSLTAQFGQGLQALGYEIIESEHPIVPLMVRDTDKTRDLVSYLLTNGVLATGLNYPVVPKGDQSIRFQINADHTATDIDEVLHVLKVYKQTR